MTNIRVIKMISFQTKVEMKIKIVVMMHLWMKVLKLVMLESLLLDLQKLVMNSKVCYKNNQNKLFINKV
jgi:hypothetical protein